MSLPLKKCPSCKFWWFDRAGYGCTKQEGRITYLTIDQIRVEQDKIYCSDYCSRKMYEYFLQKAETKQTDRMIREGDDGEIENGKVSKAKRKMTIYKKKSKKIKTSDEDFSICKPKRMIRMHDCPEGGEGK
jgi:hypothetical protein